MPQAQTPEQLQAQLLADAEAALQIPETPEDVLTLITSNSPTIAGYVDKTQQTVEVWGNSFPACSASAGAAGAAGGPIGSGVGIGFCAVQALATTIAIWKEDIGGIFGGGPKCAKSEPIPIAPTLHKSLLSVLITASKKYKNLTTEEQQYLNKTARYAWWLLYRFGTKNYHQIPNTIYQKLFTLRHELFLQIHKRKPDSGVLTAEDCYGKTSYRNLKDKWKPEFAAGNFDDWSGHDDDSDCSTAGYAIMRWLTGCENNKDKPCSNKAQYDLYPLLFSALVPLAPISTGFNVILSKCCAGAYRVFLEHAQATLALFDQRETALVLWPEKPLPPIILNAEEWAAQSGSPLGTAYSHSGKTYIRVVGPMPKIATPGHRWVWAGTVNAPDGQTVDTYRLDPKPIPKSEFVTVTFYRKDGGVAKKVKTKRYSDVYYAAQASALGSKPGAVPEPRSLTPAHDPRLVIGGSLALAAMMMYGAYVLGRR